jgi:hypothetical protein
MPEQDAVLISGAVLSSGLRDGGDGVVAIVVTGDAFGDGLAVPKTELLQNRDRSELAPPGEINAHDVESSIANGRRRIETRQ